MSLQNHSIRKISIRKYFRLQISSIHGMSIYRKQIFKKFIEICVLEELTYCLLWTAADIRFGALNCAIQTDWKHCTTDPYYPKTY